MHRSIGSAILISHCTITILNNKKEVKNASGVIEGRLKYLNLLFSIGPQSIELAATFSITSR